MELPNQQHKSIHQWVVDQVKCDQDLGEENFKYNELQCPLWVTNIQHITTVISGDI